MLLRSRKNSGNDKADVIPGIQINACIHRLISPVRYREVSQALISQFIL